MTGLKAVIGKKYHSEEIQNEITKVAYNMTESLGNVTIPVRPPHPGHAQRPRHPALPRPRAPATPRPRE